MAGYVVLGTGFGILLRNAGYGVLWAAAMSLLIYAGSMQYVGVSLLTGGASVLTTLLTTFMVNARHLFYSISMIDTYKDAGKYKPYMIFALTDGPEHVPVSGVPVQPILLGGGQRHRKLAGQRAAVFHSRNRVFHDGAFHRVIYGAVAHNEGSHPGAHGTLEHALVSCYLRKGPLSDPGYAADHACADPSSQTRGG